MSHEAIITVDAGRIVGRTASDAETLSEMEGGTYRAVFTVPNSRSVSQMRLFHKFCEVIADNYPEPIHKDGVVGVIKIESGHCDVRKLADGTYCRVPKSIAFDRMSGPAFNTFMDRALDVACVKFGAELSQAAFDQMVAMMTKPEPTRPARTADHRSRAELEPSQ